MAEPTSSESQGSDDESLHARAHIDSSADVLDSTDGSPSTADSGDATLAAAASPLGDDWGKRIWRNVGFVVFLLAAAAVAAGFLFKTDYVALVPGAARDTEPLINVEGTEAFPSDGELLFTTVRLRTNPSLWEHLWISFDDDSELVPAELILGDRSADENREANLAMMADSQDVATAVALEQLGYDTIRSNGVLILEIVDGASAVGVLEEGDVIRSIDGEPILAATELVTFLTDKVPGDEIEIEVQPVGTNERETRTVTLGPREDDPDRAFLGVGPIDQVEFLEPDVPFDVEIESGAVGGPSAGLAFTLAILDELTPGELTGGVDIAVTGTMNFDGSVGSVGGVEQKAAAVRELGIKYFIVPTALGEERLERVRERGGPDVEIVAVANIDEALAFLETIGGDVQALEDFSPTGA